MASSGKSWPWPWTVVVAMSATCLATGIGALTLDQALVERTVRYYGDGLERSLAAEVDREAATVESGSSSYLALAVDAEIGAAEDPANDAPCRLRPGVTTSAPPTAAPPACDALRGASGRALLPELLLPLGDEAVPRLLSFLERSFFLLSGAQASYLRERIEAGGFTPSNRSALLLALDSAEPKGAWPGRLSADTATLTVNGGVFRGDWRSGRLRGTLLDRSTVASRWRLVPPGPKGLDVRTAAAIGTPTRVDGLRITVSAEAGLIDRWFQRLRFGLALMSVLCGIGVVVGVRRQTQRQRERARLAALRTDFFAAVAHEVRTPIASIRLLAELLDEGLSDEADRSSVHGALRAEAVRLSNTVTSLLETARFFRGADVRARRERVPIAALADRAAGFPGVRVELVGVPMDERVYVDLVLLHLTIDNLLENAARHAPEGRPWTLTLELDALKHELVIHVRDYGPGLPAGPSERLFEAFYRGDSRLTAARGSGLGLTLVAHAARAHGGQVAASRPSGGGAQFTVRLPCAAPRESGDEDEVG